MATEQDSLLRADNTANVPVDTLAHSTEYQPHREELKKLQCRMGALIVTVFVFCAGLYMSNLDERGSRNFVIPGGHDPVVGTGGRRVSKYDATQFISFSINTLGGLDEHGESSCSFT